MKTTIIGILTIAAAATSAALNLMKGQPVDVPAVTAAITAGIGLIHASDSNPAK